MNSSIVKIRQTVPLFAVADMEKLVAFYVDGLGSVDISTEPDKSGDKTTKLRNPK